MEYIRAHDIEALLTVAVNALARAKPADVRLFLAAHFAAPAPDAAASVVVVAYEPKFISLRDLKAHGRFPRAGSAEDFAHPLTGQPNAMELLKEWDEEQAAMQAEMAASGAVPGAVPPPGMDPMAPPPPPPPAG